MIFYTLSYVERKWINQTPHLGAIISKAGKHEKHIFLCWHTFMGMD